MMGVDSQSNKEGRAAKSGGERRGFKRYITNAPLRFWYSEEMDRWQVGKMVDFSLEGLLLETPVELFPDTTLLFDFAPYYSNPLDTPLVTGHVLWKAEVNPKMYQYGVFFLVVENQEEVILEEEDRDKNILVEVLANLLMSGKAKLKNPPA